MSSTVDELVVLGAFVGALLLVVCLSIVSAFTYRERGLLLHAAGTSACVLAVEALVAGRTFLAEFAMLMVLAIDGFQLLALSSHAGALRQPRRWLVGVGSSVLPVLAFAGLAGGWHLLLPGVAAWFAVVGVIMLRTWPQSQPWATWLLLGELALAAAAAGLGWRALDAAPDPPLPLAALLTVWTAAVFLAATWRNRIFSETRLRIDARNTVDPHTGLSTPIIFYDRVQAVRSLVKRYGHPSVLLLVHIDNLDKLTAEFGPDIHEAAVLAAARRIRAALGDGDVAARLSSSRIGVLA
ncbi:MAG: diguanylate cyclase, partial [Ramlibacter sp.]